MKVCQEVKKTNGKGQIIRDKDQVTKLPCNKEQIPERKKGKESNR